MSKGNFQAVLDIGSNSLHLIIGEVFEDGTFRIVDREKSRLRLATLDKNGMPTIDKQEADLAVILIQKAMHLASFYDAPIKVVATSAVREAQQNMDFIERVQRDTGLQLTVITGEQEAAYIYSGVCSFLPEFKKSKILCFDIGGGSTELIIGENGESKYLNSLKMGSVRLAKKFFPNFEVRDYGINACREHVAHLLSEVTKPIQAIGFENCVGSAGTVKSVATIMEQYRIITPTETEPKVITKEKYKEVFDLVMSKPTFKERCAAFTIEEKRIDVLPAGMIIMEGIFEHLGVEKVTYSDYALREGVLFSTIDQTEAV